MNLRRNMLIPAAALVLLVSSCNYLDVSDQLAGGLQNTDEVFETYLIPNAGMRPYLPEYPIIPDLTVPM